MKLAAFTFFCVFAPFSFAAPVSFEREVMPLLERRCNKCHHPEEQRGGLDLTRISTMLRGGDDLGPALVPGRPEESPLVQVLTGAKKPEMPKKGERLPASEIDVLRRWIAEGAKDDTPAFASEDVAFFEKEIRPVLAGRCFKCHAGDEPEHGLRLTSRQGILSGGERGPAAVPGKAAESLLMQAIRHEGELKMPRRGDKLGEAQIAAFERWIDRGMAWPANEKVLARAKKFTISDAERNHWAFKPLPPVDAKWSVDATLQPHHDRLGIKAADEADRYRLLRRVTYDLTGHPPTPEEMAAFLAETERPSDHQTGGQSDKEKGGSLSPHPMVSLSAYEKLVDRLLGSPHYGVRWGRHWMDYTRMGANAQSNRGPGLDADRYAAWVAQCLNEDRPWDWFARVHLAGDKMKAFDGAEYSLDQALAAAVPLNGQRTFEDIGTETFVLMDKLDEGIEFMGRALMGISLECARCHDHKFDPISQRDYYALLGYFQSSWYAPVPVKAQSRAEAENAATKHRDLIAEQARLNSFIRQTSIKLNVGGGGRVKLWQESRIPILAPKDKRLRELEVAVLRAELADAIQKKSERLAKDLRTTLEEREAKLKHHQPPQYDFRRFQEVHYFIGGHKTQLGLIKRAEALHEDALVRELEEHLTYWEDERLRWIERSRFGGYAKTDPEVAELAKADTRIDAITAELVSNPAQPWTPLKDGYSYVRVDGGLRRAEDLKPLDDKAKAAGLEFNSNDPRRVWMHPYFVGDARLLLRGDVLYPDEIVPRATPQFFGPSNRELEGSGRLQLADWLTAPGSTQAALVARATVNRAWQHLFGEALCRTPKELGRVGEQPDLPELIDGLAARFVASGWSMKTLIREIVLSQAYRRSAVIAEKEAAKDPENRFFAHQSVRRLEYEPILNTMARLRTGQTFASTGKLDDADYAPYFDRPTVYDVIDRRVASISATQALFLMNHPQAARDLAGKVVNRLKIDAKTTLPDVLTRLYEVLLQRPPSDDERAFAQTFIKRRRAQTGASQPRDEISEFVTLILCSNEILYIE